MAGFKAKVARTAHDRTHINKLRIPHCAIKELRLKSAGGKSSISYTLSKRQTKADAASGSDQFHFAPVVEKVTIFYKIEDPLRRISKAKIEIFSSFDSKPIWSRPLKEDEYAHGLHNIEWDGTISLVHASPHDFEHVTAELSPYKMKLTIAADDGLAGEPSCAWTYFHVLIKKIELELGDKTVLVDDKDKKLYDTLGGHLPAEGAQQELYLVSNLFKTSSPEMTSNQAYEVYRTLWGDGPRVPIFLRIWLADSEDREVDAPRGIGNLKFLWDWEDMPAAHPAGLKAQAQAFIDDALNFDKQKTKPKGDNCHLERGGKRGPDAPPVFPNQPGQNPPPATLTGGTFPFRVEPCKTRKWAAYSYAWGEGALAGRTGVLFQPSRMAGDAYKLTVYLAYHRKSDKSILLDIEDDAPLKAVLKRSTGTFAIRRELHVISYKLKRVSVAPLINLATVEGAYDKAYLRLANKAGTPTPIGKADYNSQVATVVAGQAWHVGLAVDSVDQYDAGDHFIHYRTHAQWTAQVDAYVAAQGWTAPQKLAWAAGLSNSAGSDPYTNSSVYYQFLYDWALSMIPSVCDKFMSASDGINIFQFTNLYNTPLPKATNLNGFAAVMPSGNRYRCGFIQCGSNYGGAGSLNTREQTCAHEIGHQLFLPHTWQVSLSHDPPPGSHDRADTACMMSYQFGSARAFCGLCLLRLRGWSKLQADKTGTTNATRTLSDSPPNSNHRI